MVKPVKRIKNGLRNGLRNNKYVLDRYVCYIHVVCYGIIGCLFTIQWLLYHNGQYGSLKYSSYVAFIDIRHLLGMAEYIYQF